MTKVSLARRDPRRRQIATNANARIPDCCRLPRFCHPKRPCDSCSPRNFQNLSPRGFPSLGMSNRTVQDGPNEQSLLHGMDRRNNASQRRSSCLFLTTNTEILERTGSTTTRLQEKPVDCPFLAMIRKRHLWGGPGMKHSGRPS